MFYGFHDMHDRVTMLKNIKKYKEILFFNILCVAYVLIWSSIISIYFLLFNFSIMLLPSYRVNQYLASSVDETEVVAPFEIMMTCSVVIEIRLNSTFFLSVNLM